MPSRDEQTVGYIEGLTLLIENIRQTMERLDGRIEKIDGKFDLVTEWRESVEVRLVQVGEGVTRLAMDAEWRKKIQEKVDEHDRWIGPMRWAVMLAGGLIVTASLGGCWLLITHGGNILSIIPTIVP